VSGQLQECRAGGRELQVLGDATEKLQAPNAMWANRMVSRLVLDDLRERAGVWKHRRECKYAGCE